MPCEITMSYDNLIEALNTAIDREAAENNGKFVTDERIESVVETTYDYDALMAEFKNLVTTLMAKSQTNGAKITSIVETYLGKGKKVGETTPSQAEFIYLIVTDMKDLLEQQ